MDAPLKRDTRHVDGSRSLRAFCRCDPERDIDGNMSVRRWVAQRRMLGLISCTRLMAFSSANRIQRVRIPDD